MLISPKLLRSAAFLVLSFVWVLPTAFAQSGGIKGKVRTQSGSGIPNAEIAVRQNGEDIKTTKADSKGEFQITGISAGKYNIAFDAPGYSMGVMHNVEIGTKVRDLGGGLILSKDRGTLVLVQGSVFFREGTSVTGAQIKLEQVLGDGSIKDLGTTFSNSSGEFSFRRPAGAARLRVTAKLKSSTASKDVEVDDPAIYRVALNLPMSSVDR